MEPVNIFDMVTKEERMEIELKNKTYYFIFSEYKKGREKEEIFEDIKKIGLPLGLHLHVSAKFSEICKYGRALTTNERKILNM